MNWVLQGLAGLKAFADQEQNSVRILVGFVANGLRKDFSRSSTSRLEAWGGAVTYQALS